MDSPCFVPVLFTYFSLYLPSWTWWTLVAHRLRTTVLEYTNKIKCVKTNWTYIEVVSNKLLSSTLIHVPTFNWVYHTASYIIQFILGYCSFVARDINACISIRYFPLLKNVSILLIVKKQSDNPPTLNRRVGGRMWLTQYFHLYSISNLDWKKK